MTKVAALSDEIAAVEALVGGTLPPTVQTWLARGTPTHLFGLPLLGLPLGPAPDNIWGATLLLQATRPDLPPEFLAIRLLDGRALCVSAQNGEEASMVEIELEGDAVPRVLGQSFPHYLEQGVSDCRRTEQIFDHVEAVLTRRGYTYDHARGGKLPRAHQPRIVRSCVHDMVVGIAELRQDEASNLTAIGLFECTDHPLYQPGHGVRSLTSLVLADAYKSGGSMALRFEQVGDLRGKVVPTEVAALARASGVELSAANLGRISQDEGVELFAAISGLSAHAIGRVKDAATHQRLSVEALSFLILSNCWTAAEAEWVLHNAPRPAAVLFGEDGPENWLLKTEASAFGRAAILATMLRSSLTGSGEEGADTASCTISSGMFVLEPRRPCVMPWLADRPLLPGQSIAVLPRPRLPLAFEASLVDADAHALAAACPAATVRWLVYSAEAIDAELNAARPGLEALGVELVISPYRLSDLQEIYEGRLNRARRIRR